MPCDRPHLSRPPALHVLIPLFFRQELIPGSHTRWRTDFEHDVLLPKDAKDEGTPYTPSWDGESILPETTALRLKAGECAPSLPWTNLLLLPDVS